MSTSDEPIIFVGHSLGCIAVVAWAQVGNPESLRQIAGAFLVAPADVEQPDAPAVLRTWRPVPLKVLPFPSVLVASQNDNVTSFERTERFANAWGSELVNIGAAGHVNTASGHGPWPDGHNLLVDFVARLT